MVLLINGTNGGNRFLRRCFVAMASFRGRSREAMRSWRRLARAIKHPLQRPHRDAKQPADLDGGDVAPTGGVVGGIPA